MRIGGAPSLRTPIKVAAFSDVHGPEYTHYLSSALGELRQADLLLMAGDIVHRGFTQHCRAVVDLARKVFEGTILAVFGNEEYDEREGELRALCPDVVWLKDEAANLEVKGVAISVVGTRGVLDEPTSWQRRNIPGIEELYEKRLRVIEDLLAKARRVSHYVVLLTHYPPICSTLEGEPARIWSQMGSRRLTQIIERLKPDVVVHGHAHKSVKLQARIGSSRVYNVALPAAKRVTTIELGPQGLEAFF